MNDESLTKTLSFLDANKLIRIFKINNNIFKKFIIKLIENYNQSSIFYNDYKISNYINFVPLPSFLTSSNTITNENKKNIYNKNDNTMYVGNLCLPHPTISPIPFSFGYTYKKLYNLTITNTYYYEITIDNNNNYKKIDKPVISIGFNSINNRINEQQTGWQNNSIGLHSDDSKFFYNGKSNKNLFKFGPNDIIGCGLIYTEYEKYIPFYTKNGKNLIILDEVYIKGKITPCIGYDYNYSFSINFGNSQFKYKIQNMINYANNVISNKNLFIKNGYNIKIYKFIVKKIIKIYKKPYMYNPFKKIHFNIKKNNNDEQEFNENIENIENIITNNLLQISTSYIDSQLNDEIENTTTTPTNENLSIIGNQINLPGNNNLSFNSTLNNIHNSFELSPIQINNFSQLNDPELPNYSNDSNDSEYSEDSYNSEYY